MKDKSKVEAEPTGKAEPKVIAKKRMSHADKSLNTSKNDQITRVRSKNSYTQHYKDKLNYKADSLNVSRGSLDHSSLSLRGSKLFSTNSLSNVGNLKSTKIGNRVRSSVIVYKKNNKLLNISAHSPIKTEITSPRGDDSNLSKINFGDNPQDRIIDSVEISYSPVNTSTQLDDGKKSRNDLAEMNLRQIVDKFNSDATNKTIDMGETDNYTLGCQENKDTILDSINVNSPVKYSAEQEGNKLNENAELTTHKTEVNEDQIKAQQDNNIAEQIKNNNIDINLNSNPPTVNIYKRNTKLGSRNSSTANLKPDNNLVVDAPSQNKQSHLNVLNTSTNLNQSKDKQNQNLNKSLNNSSANLNQSKEGVSSVNSVYSKLNKSSSQSTNKVQTNQLTNSSQNVKMRNSINLERKSLKFVNTPATSLSTSDLSSTKKKTKQVNAAQPKFIRKIDKKSSPRITIDLSGSGEEKKILHDADNIHKSFAGEKIEEIIEEDQNLSDTAKKEGEAEEREDNQGLLNYSCSSNDESPKVTYKAETTELKLDTIASEEKESGNTLNTLNSIKKHQFEMLSMVSPFAENFTLKSKELPKPSELLSVSKSFFLISSNEKENHLKYISNLENSICIPSTKDKTQNNIIQLSHSLRIKGREKVPPAYHICDSDFFINRTYNKYPGFVNNKVERNVRLYIPKVVKINNYKAFKEIDLEVSRVVKVNNYKPFKEVDLELMKQVINKPSYECSNLNLQIEGIKKKIKFDPRLIRLSKSCEKSNINRIFMLSNKLKSLLSQKEKSQRNINTQLSQTGNILSPQTNLSHNSLRVDYKSDNDQFTAEREEVRNDITSNLYEFIKKKKDLLIQPANIRPEQDKLFCDNEISNILNTLKNKTKEKEEEKPLVYDIDNLDDIPINNLKTSFNVNNKSRSKSPELVSKINIPKINESLNINLNTSESKFKKRVDVIKQRLQESSQLSNNYNNFNSNNININYHMYGDNKITYAAEDPVNDSESLLITEEILSEIREKHFGKSEFIDRDMLVRFYKRHIKKDSAGRVCRPRENFENKISSNSILMKKEELENKQKTKKLKELFNIDDEGKTNKTNKLIPTHNLNNAGQFLKDRSPIIDIKKKLQINTDNSSPFGVMPSNNILTTKNRQSYI